MALMQKFMASEKPRDIDPPPPQPPPARRYDDHRKQIDASEMAPLTCRPLKRNWPNERRRRGERKMTKDESTMPEMKTIPALRSSRATFSLFISRLSYRSKAEKRKKIE
jgi:hypothetical protein